jgi:hypothetical protein
MTRYLTTIQGPKSRNDAMQLVARAPLGTRVELKAAKRTMPQNDKLWACLTDVSRQVEWYGQKLRPDDWKDMFTASLRKARVVPGIDPDSFVLLGLHTSDMTKDEMSNLLELILAFGAERGVVFHDQPEQAEAA